jgi:GNAT superfamily N-acetyltransferase
VTAVAPAVAAGDARVVREATTADNAALLELTAACPMHGDIALRMDRAPDFFALTRLEGDEARVGVVEDDAGRLLGCAAVARRVAYVGGVETLGAYACDLKVHPAARGGGAADALSYWVRDTAAELAGRGSLCTLTILAGNSSMERRAAGPRGTPVLHRFATLSVGAIPLLWERRERVAGRVVRAASGRDLEEMAALWARIAPRRQFAPVLDAGALAAWIAAAPGLDVRDYLVAAGPTGRIVGFLGVWDQTSFKQMRVVDYSPRLALVRRAFNAAAPLVGAPSLPEPGGALPALATVHVCADDPRVLRALLLEAYRRHRGGRFAFLTVGLDVRDPLLAATRGLLAQPTMVDAYVSRGRLNADPEPLRALPLHHESALV